MDSKENPNSEFVDAADTCPNETSLVKKFQEKPKLPGESNKFKNKNEFEPIPEVKHVKKIKKATENPRFRKKICETVNEIVSERVSDVAKEKTKIEDVDSVNPIEEEAKKKCDEIIESLDISETKYLLVVDEKETCVAQFVSENDMERIWKEPTKTKDPDKQPFTIKEEIEPLPEPALKNINKESKKTENPLFRKKIDVKEFKEDNAKDVQNVEQDVNVKNKMCDEMQDELNDQGNDLADFRDDPQNDELTQESAKSVIRYVFNNCCKQPAMFSKCAKFTWSMAFVNAMYFVNMVLTLSSNRWLWNVFTVILKVSIAVFVYLVLACSTILVSVMINSHDAYVKTRNGQLNYEETSESDSPSVSDKKNHVDN